MKTACGYKVCLITLSLVLAAVALCVPAKAHAQDTETLPLLVVVVGFAGDDTSEPVEYDEDYDWSGAIFGTDDSLASYYLDMSQGSFTFAPAHESSTFGQFGNVNLSDSIDDGIVHVTLNQPHGRWGTVNEDKQVALEFAQVVMDALTASSSCIDFSSYDKNGDGMLAPDELAICVCVAGYEASGVESYRTSDLPLMWSHAGLLSVLDDGQRSVDGILFDSYIAISEYFWFNADPAEEVEWEPLGVLYHELGHYLGLPDLYSVENPDDESGAWADYQVRSLSLMDNGGWAYVQYEYDWEYEPAALDAWSRYVLGWVHPTMVTQSGDYVVSDQQSSAGYSSLLVPTNRPGEFYLVENRQPTGHDASIPTSYPGAYGGIVIWHIDTLAYRAGNPDNTVNVATHHPAIMELFYEFSDAGTTVGWPSGAPDANRPFFDAGTCEELLGPGAYVELPLYSDASSPDVPEARTESGIVFSVPAESSSVMTIHIEMPDYNGATSSSYPLEEKTADGQVEGPCMGTVACAAMLNETQADVAFVDAASIQGAFGEGTLSWNDVYGVLAGDAHITRRQLTGGQISDILERSLEFSHEDGGADGGQAQPNAGRSALAFAGIACTVDWAQQAGSRITGLAIDGVPIDPEKTYLVAVTDSAVALEAYPEFALASPDISFLWGDANDAIRSFVLSDSWEQVVTEASQAVVYEKHEVSASSSAEVETVPWLPIGLGCLALLLVVIGAVVTARSRVRR